MCPRVRIEDKHVYTTTPQRELYTRITRTGNSVDFYPQLVINMPNYPITGTDENNRVGRKIQTTSIMSEGYIRLNNQTGVRVDALNSFVPIWRAFYERQREDSNYQIPGYLGRKALAMDQNPPQTSPSGNSDGGYYFNPLIENFDVSIRHFVVEFKDVGLTTLDNNELNDYLRLWYKQLVIQITQGTDYNANPDPSNSMQILRESTEFTGQFRILYDKTHHLTKSNQTIHYSYTIPYKRHLNFDAAGSVIPTENIVLEIFIPAWQNSIDFGNLDFGNYLYDFMVNAVHTTNVNISQGFINSTIKLKYMDF